VSDKSSLKIVLLNKEYQIACQEHERNHLLECATFLNARMEEMQDVHKTARPERLALMVALNLSNEVLLSRSSKLGAVNVQSLLERMRGLSDNVDWALEERAS
jgi:cell division protein ZapA